ncbi:MAG: hypothetical protein ACLVJ6_08925 [Merdibacter sp.]
MKSVRWHILRMKRQAFIIFALAIAPKLLLLDEGLRRSGSDDAADLQRALARCVEEKMTVLSPRTTSVS